MRSRGRLDELENESIYVLREARRMFGRIACLWSIGKDSTTLLWLIRKAFFGEVPFITLHIDTTYKFAEIYEFRDRVAREWRLDLVVHRNDEALASGASPFTRTTLQCCSSLKTEALRQAIERHRLEAVLLGIRADEHGVRAKERVFSPRNEAFEWNYRDQPPELWDIYPGAARDCHHVRVHPLLHWRELDVWEYIEREGIPCVGLYFASGGRRFRSIGCRTCCAPMESAASSIGEIVSELRVVATTERSGRAQDKEHAATMEKLRALGYM